MRCVEVDLDELEQDGWMVNQTRMWLASQWSVRRGADWHEGEQHFFTHLLDGRRSSVTPVRTSTRARSGTGPRIHPWSRPIRVCGPTGGAGLAV